MIQNYPRHAFVAKCALLSAPRRTLTPSHFLYFHRSRATEDILVCLALGLFALNSLQHKYLVQALRCVLLLKTRMACACFCA